MKIAIVGAGAMGALYGVVLNDKGHEVTLIDKNTEHVEAINQEGLTMNHVKGNGEVNYKMRAVTDSKQIDGAVDLLIILVKTYLTETAVEENLNLIGDHTIVLTLQNGAGNIEKIEKFINKQKIIAGVTSTSGFVTKPGYIMHTGDGGTHFGEIDGSITDRIKMVQELFRDDRLGPAFIEENVMSLIWEKLIANCGINPVGALTYLNNGEELTGEEKVWLFDRITEEALAVAEAEGIKLPFDDRTGITKVCEATAANQTSMMIDVKNMRKTEIEAINGEIVRKGRIHGISTPVNETLLNLVLLREKSYLNN